MLKGFIFLFAVFIAGGCSTSLINISIQTDQLLDNAVENAIEKKQVRGAVLVVGCSNRILKDKAYGFRQALPEDGLERMTGDTIFDMASLTKVVATATMCALLIEDGIVSLDDPVSKLLPAWPDKRITVRNLATHTSGFIAYLNPETARIAERYPKLNSYDAVVRAIADSKRAYKVGEGFTYSCLNYELLARALEEAAGENMESFLKRRVWDKLDMKDTTFRVPPEKINRCAPTLKGLRGIVHDPLARFYGTGVHLPGNAGLFSTGRDLALFLQMLLSGGKVFDKKVMKPGTVKMLFDNQAPQTSGIERGIGWIISKNEDFLPCKGKYAVRLHTGFTGTFLWLDLDSRMFCVLLTSRLHPAGKGMAGPVRKAVIKVLCKSLRGHAK